MGVNDEIVAVRRGHETPWKHKTPDSRLYRPFIHHTPLTKETLDSEFFQANARTMIPAERYGNEGELDTAVLFLSSPASSYVTGIMVPVDGGYTCM